MGAPMKEAPIHVDAHFLVSAAHEATLPPCNEGGSSSRQFRPSYTFTWLSIGIVIRKPFTVELKTINITNENV
jgi:hypothetical protein